MTFTHIDEQGRPGMVDVGDKQVTARIAVARAILDLPPVVAELLDEGEISSPKGPVFSTAILAGVQAAKKTPDLIPLCHVVPLDGVSVEITPSEDGRELTIDCRAKATHKTGVEMEALTGATMAALTIYDMTKALSREVVVREIRLMEKSGGKDDFRRED